MGVLPSDEDLILQTFGSTDGEPLLQVRPLIYFSDLIFNASA